MKITNVKSNATYSKEVVRTITGKIRKQLVTMNVSDKTLQEKKKKVTKTLLKIYGAIPDGVSFSKRKTKDSHNPDGYRLFVVCSWIKRNRFYDINGIFKIGSLVQAINRQIDGTTKKCILKKEKQHV